MQDIIRQLIDGAKPYSEIKKFGEEAGIYALFFLGEQFPLKTYSPARGEVIYIGKTETSQQSRDADTHFATGRTGSSTLRKTFGALLSDEVALRPIARSEKDIAKKRHAHFKFDMASEEIITKWMRQNLGLSFYPFAGSAIELDMLETELIQALVPILNIDRKNPANKYSDFIRAKRKAMSDLAYGELQSMVQETAGAEKRGVQAGAIHKYEAIWEGAYGAILSALTSGEGGAIKLSKASFVKAGNRKRYAFDLVFENGAVVNNIGGSAVARDLARVLESKNEFPPAVKGNRVRLKMNKDFVLHISMD